MPSNTHAKSWLTLNNDSEPADDDFLAERPDMFATMEDELRPEYDLSQLLRDGVRGKYAKRFRAGTNLASLPDDDIKVSSEQTGLEDNPNPAH